MYNFLRIFFVGWWLFSCSSNDVGRELKKANPKDFGFLLLSVNTKEVSLEKIQSILKAPAGWTIKSIKIDDTSYAEVMGISFNYFKIKKPGTFSFSITLQKTGYEDFVLKGIKIKATFKADAKDFSFKLLELTGAKEVTIEQIKKNLKAPAGWTIKSLKIDHESFAAVTGTSVKDFKITIKKSGTFTINITLQKTGYEDFVLKGNIKATLKADAKDFSFPLLEVNAREVTIEQVKKNLNAPAGWTIKSIKIDDATYADVDSQLKITIKKPGTFAINITLQKTGYEDYVLKGIKIKATFLANAKDFSFPLLSVNTNEVTIEQVKKNLNAPAGWTIKSIKIDDTTFADVDSQLKITIKKSGTFAINITLQKTKWVDYVLKGSIEAKLPPIVFGNLLFERATGTITGVTDRSIKTIDIPNEIDGVAVTTIGYRAFRYCSSLPSVTIPNSVTTIGEGAFSDCTSLTSVTIPNSVTTIGEQAFAYCSKLPSVTIPNSVTTIGDGAFSDCTSLTSVTIPNSVTTIGEWVFEDCTSLTSVTIGNSVTKIDEWAFKNCSSLTSVTIGNSVKTIEYEAFRNCSKLTSITIPNSVTTIGWNAFRNCSKLASVTIPNSVTTIGDSAFRECSSLPSVTIPNSVTTIGKYGFYKCSKLTSVTIPNSVTTIAPSVFLRCSALESVTIPNSVTTIEAQAFAGCSALKSVTVPRSVTEIGRLAFGYCSALTIRVPNSVTKIGDNAFWGVVKIERY